MIIRWIIRSASIDYKGLFRYCPRVLLKAVDFLSADVAGDLRDSGIGATAFVLDGDPKDALVREAEQWKADGIFVGAKGHSAMDRFLLGSVSTAVAARAHCSVEVVRQG